MLDVTSPRYGATGDGVADDTGAVRDAFEDARRGDRISFPPGRTYVVDSIDLGEVGTADLTLACHRATIRKHPNGRFGNANDGHLFVDRHGTCDGLRVLGGRFELSGAQASPGDTVSAFHLVRCDDLFFALVEITDGVEEGAKLYKCRNVTWVSPRISRCRNNGLQCHAPEADGYLGEKNNQGWSRWRVYGGRVEDIDDGLLGTAEGQGITFNSTDPAVFCGDVIVEGVAVSGCNRGLWAEFNLPGTRANDLTFKNNLVRGSRWFGLGMVGVLDARITGNHVVDTGYRAPGPETSSEVTGVVVSGSAGAPSRNVAVVDNAIRDEREEPWMEVGLAVRQAEGVTVARNEVAGWTESAYAIDPTASGDFDVSPTGVPPGSA